MMTHALIFAAAIFILGVSSAQTLRPDGTTTTKPITEPKQGGTSARIIATGPADQPASRNDDSTWLSKHIELVEKAKKGNIDLYFEGDSITRRWEALHRASWDQNFGGWQPGNFGAGGDRTQNVLYRLANGELDGVTPKVIVLMIGTNNVGFVPINGGDDALVEEVTRGIKACVDLLHKKAPKAKILLMGITPRNTNGSMALMPTINKINERIARFADDQTIR